MEYGAIDLHLKASLIRIVDADGVVRRGPHGRDDARGVDAGVRGAGAAAGAGRERDGERVGGADARGLRARGDRGRSELRADVWAAGAADQDGPSGCGGAGRGVSAGHLPRGAPGVGGATRGPAGGADAGAIGADADADDQSAAGAAPAGRDPVAARRGRDGGARASMRWRCPAALRAGLAPLRAVLASLAPLIAAATADVGGARQRRPGGAPAC